MVFGIRCCGQFGDSGARSTIADAGGVLLLLKFNFAGTEPACAVIELARRWATVFTKVVVSAPLDSVTAAAVRKAGFRVHICLDDGGHYSVQESMLWAMNLTEELEIEGGIVFLQVSLNSLADGVTDGAVCPHGPSVVRAFTGSQSLLGCVAFASPKALEFPFGLGLFYSLSSHDHCYPWRIPPCLRSWARWQP